MLKPMYLVDVVPITRTMQAGSLSYFSSTSYPLGAIVKVELRKKQAPAIVVETRDATTAKEEIRTAAYKTKKLPKQKPQFLFSESFVRAVADLSDYFATSIGAVLASSTPSAILTSQNISSFVGGGGTSDMEAKTVVQKSVLQASPQERIDQYRRLTRESFAQGTSLFLLCPTRIEAIRLHVELSRGVEEYAVLLHAGMTKKQQLKTWENALAIEHPILLIGTSSFLSIPRDDIGMIIVEHERSRAYKEISRPFLDARRLAEYVAQYTSSRLVLADIPLRVETRFQHEEQECDELIPIASRIAPPVPLTILDVRTPADVQGKKKKFSALSQKALSLLSPEADSPKQAFIYTARRGFAGLTICGDCETPVSCHACDAFVVLHKSVPTNVFLCHACGASRSAKEVCAHCKSWKLTALGVGVERIEEELLEAFPDVAPLRIDKDATSTPAQVKKVARQFEISGGILIGTEMALPYLPKEIPTIVVASLDSLLSLPDWNTHERVFSLLINLRTRVTQSILVQSRQPDISPLLNAKSGAIAEFYRQEIALREEFSYPPFSILIKISATGKREQVEKKMELVRNLLKPEELIQYTPIIHKGKGVHISHGLLRIAPSAWPQPRLMESLRSLPPDIVVQVSPESLL